MILEPGQAIYHPFFAHGVVREITRARDSGCDLDRHRIEFADGTYRDIVGTQRFCLAGEVSRFYPEFETGDAVCHHRVQAPIPEPIARFSSPGDT